MIEIANGGAANRAGRDEEATGLAEERHTTAFVVGAVLGGLAGAGLVLWAAPRSGAETCALIAEKAEGVLFRLSGMDKVHSEGTSTAAELSSSEAVMRPVSEEVAADVDTAPIPVPVPVAETVDDEDDGARLPTTFRGEVLTEKPIDVVLDGPRPAPTDR
jgi:gas vesicle protein